AMSAGTLEEPSADSMQAMAMGISTADAVQQGKAVIDGGATKTLASISAMERIMQLNNMKKGDSGLISVDLSERPVFGFGNGSEDRIRTVAAPTKASSVSTMPKPTKADLQAELALLGETAPAGWTKLELEQRLRELRELGVTDHENVRANTSMEKMMKDLRRASRLKSTLAKYCTETLQLELTGNEVMAKLIDKATKEIYRVCPAEGHDLVSFGKHADECYITLATEYPEYATWVKTTYKENGEEHVEPRLARLAK
ncbi:unnamed protein product, partial [Symbiodinium necroappetens]